MVNWHDPVLLLRDYRALRILTISRCNSDKLPFSRSYQAGSRGRRSLYVRLRPRLFAETVHTDLDLHLFSWETVFSAGFELSVLRGKQPYRWTIWVSR